MPSATPRKKDPAKVIALYEPSFQDNFTLFSKAKKGLDPKAVFDFVYISDFTQTLIEFILNKTMKTFENYRVKNKALDVGTSEKLLKLFALYNKGQEVFGSVNAFSNWLSKPAYGLGKAIPQTMLDTMTGIDLVNEELVRIEYGDLA